VFFFFFTSREFIEIGLGKTAAIRKDNEKEERPFRVEPEQSSYRLERTDRVAGLSCPDS